MDTRLKVLLLVLIFKCDAAFADATPVKNKGQIDFMDKTSKALQFDSCGIIYKNYQTNRLDTFFHCEGAECIAVVDKNSIRLSRHIPDHFKVIFYYGDKILSSPTLNCTGLNSYHQLLITDTGVKDVTPIFKTQYSNYFIALLTTILLELFVGFIYFWRYKIQFKKLPYIAYLNLLTHPVLWLVSANLTGFAFGNLIGEPLVVIIEGLLLFQLMKPNLTMGQSLWLSFLMNIVSFVLGGFVYFIATS